MVKNPRFGLRFAGILLVAFVSQSSHSQTPQNAAVPQDNGKSSAQSLEELKQGFEALQKRYEKLEETISFLSQTHPSVGSVVAFAGPQNQIPDDWMLCDGRPLDRGSFADVFAKIGTLWGSGDGSKTFNLPNLEGLFLRGVDHGSGPDSTKNRPVGDIESYSTALPKVPFVTDDPGDHVHPHQLEMTASRNVQNATTRNTVTSSPTGPDRNTGPAGHHTHKIVSGGDAETRPVNAAILWIIKVR